MVYTFLQCCLDPIERFGDGANDAYLEYFLRPEEAKPLGLEPGLTVLREANLHLLPETPRQLWQRLIAQYKVPVKYQYGLLAQILIRQRFHELPMRQMCLSIRILALSALGTTRRRLFAYCSMACQGDFLFCRGGLIMTACMQPWSKPLLAC